MTSSPPESGTRPAVVAAEAVEALRALVASEAGTRAAVTFPTSLEILGVSGPELRRVLDALADLLRGEAPAAVLDMAHALCATGVQEARELGWALIGDRPDVLAGLDAHEVERLGRGNDNEAAVDAFAARVAGPAWRAGPVHDADVQRWARSPERWWRRTAVMATVALNVRARSGHGDVERTLAVCEVARADADPVVTRGLSRALCALADADRAAAAAFLLRHGEGVAASVRREVASRLASGRGTGR